MRKGILIMPYRVVNVWHDHFSIANGVKKKFWIFDIHGNVIWLAILHIMNDSHFIGVMSGTSSQSKISLKKNTKIILLITRGAVSLVMCSSGFVSSFFHLVWYSAFIFSCLPLFNHVGLCPKVHPRKFLLKDLELNLRKERVILGKVTYWSKSALLHNFIRLNPCIGPCYI